MTEVFKYVSNAKYSSMNQNKNQRNSSRIRIRNRNKYEIKKEMEDYSFETTIRPLGKVVTTL